MYHTNAFSYVKELRGCFLAHMASRLDATICEQSKIVFAEENIIVPVTSTSVIIFLLRHGDGTIADMCRIDGQSHQLATSRVQALIKLDLVTTYKDENDQRKQVLTLTDKGLEQAHKIERVLNHFAAALSQLNDQFGIDLFSTLEDAEKSIRRYPLHERIADIKQKEAL